MAKSAPAYSVEEAVKIAENWDIPVLSVLPIPWAEPEEELSIRRRTSEGCRQRHRRFYGKPDPH